jgi:hypothetical protein
MVLVLFKSAVAKLLKATIGFITSVSPSLRMDELYYDLMDFHVS